MRGHAILRLADLSHPRPLGYFDTLPIYCSHPPCKDTLTGWMPFDPDQGATPYDESHFEEVNALGRTLFARNTYGDIYFRTMGNAWRKLDLGEKAANMNAMAVEGSRLYVLANSGRIYQVDTEGHKTFLEKIPDSLTCPLPGTAPCHASKIFRYRGRFLVEGIQPYTDSTFHYFLDSLIGYNLAVGQDGRWERMRWQNGFRPPLNLTFRKLWFSGDSILGASYEDGVWAYDGMKWDSLPVPKIPNPGAPSDTLVLRKWGGVAVFQGSVYAAPWSSGLFRLEGKELRKIILKAVTNKNDTILWDGFFNWGLDTLCGNLIDVHGAVRWKPDLIGWTRMVDTTQAYAVRGFNYAIANVYSLVRIGDTLFAAHEAPLLGERDSIPGGVSMLNLRDAPWSEDAWKRRQAPVGTSSH